MHAENHLLLELCSAINSCWLISFWSWDKQWCHKHWSFYYYFYILMSRNFFKALKKLCPNFGWFPCIKCWLWPLVHLLTGWQSFHRRNNSFQEHNTLFSAHMQPCSVYTKYGPCRIPPTLMIRRLNYLLSTHCTLNKFCPLMIFCNGFSQNGAPWFAAYFVLKIYPTSCENGVSEHAVARFGQFDVFFVFFFHKMRHFS